jgi:hypothetical protein
MHQRHGSKANPRGREAEELRSCGFAKRMPGAEDRKAGRSALVAKVREDHLSGNAVTQSSSARLLFGATGSAHEVRRGRAGAAGRCGRSYSGSGAGAGDRNVPRRARTSPSEPERPPPSQNVPLRERELPRPRVDRGAGEPIRCGERTLSPDRQPGVLAPKLLGGQHATSSYSRAGLVPGPHASPGLNTCGSRPSVTSCPYDCDTPPGPFGATLKSRLSGAVGSSFRPEKTQMEFACAGPAVAVPVPVISPANAALALTQRTTAHTATTTSALVRIITLPCRCTNPILKTKESKPLFEVVTGGTRRGESAIDVLRVWPFALVGLPLEGGLRTAADVRRWARTYGGGAARWGER